VNEYREQLDADRAKGLEQRHRFRLEMAAEREAPKWSDLFGIDPDYAKDALTDEAITRAEVASEIYFALKARRDEALKQRAPGWPLLTEAMVICHEIGRLQLGDPNAR